MDEVSEVFSVMSHSVEFVFRILESVGRGGVAKSRNSTEKEAQQREKTEMAKAMARESANGSMDMNEMRALYGNSALASVLIPQEDLAAFLESADQVGVPFSMGQTYDYNGRQNGVLITYSKTNEGLLAGVLQSVEARHLTDREGMEMLEEAQPVAPLRYRDYMTARKDHEQKFEFVICELSDPAVIGTLDRELHQMQVPHRFSAADGRWHRDPDCNTCLTFMSDRTQDVQDAMTRLHVRLERPPDQMHAQLFVREGLRHALHRARYEAQEAEKTEGVREAVYLQITGLSQKEGKVLLQHLRRQNIEVVADDGDNGIDILITDEERKRSAQCLHDLGIYRSFRKVSDLEMEKVWLPRAGVEIFRMDARITRNRAARAPRENGILASTGHSVVAGHDVSR